MRFINFLSLFAVLCLLPSLVLAQGYDAYCSHSESTATSQKCLKSHLDGAQKRLNSVYKNLSDKLEAPQLQQLKDLQATWLVYRDAECLWEMERSITPTLKGINEMSCMVRVTENRVDILTVAYADGDRERATHEYGSFPRWMNALSRDYPEVYWDYGNRSRFDLDCDGDGEYIMQGVITSLVKSEVASGDEDDSPVYKKSVVIAIAQNPPIGRPVVEVLEFKVGGNNSQFTLCSDDVALKFAHKAVIKKDQDIVEGQACRAFVQIDTKNKGCTSKIISWTGKKFALEVEKTSENIEKK